MVVKITNDNATFVANKKNETFLVEADTSLVFVNDSFGILAQNASGGRTFRIDGTVNAAKDSATAIALVCSATNEERIIVGSTGEVRGTFTAISVNGGLVDIRIAGKVEADSSAIVLSADVANLRNSGSIEGGTSSAATLKLFSDTSILKNSGEITSSVGNVIAAFGDSTSITNSGLIETRAQDFSTIFASEGKFALTNTGTVSSENGVAIFLGGPSGIGKATIVNDGTIAGQDVAIEADSAPSNDAFTIVNTGDIIGDVDLSGSARNDIVDTSNGRVEGDVLTGAGNDRILLVDAVVTGAVSGGEGDDTYTISSNAISIEEDVDGGTDTIRATGNVSIILPDNFENVVLIGTNDTQATGNAADNRMTGNDGNNFIEGANGEDTIRGSKGRDELIGGGDADTFIFRKGDGKDLIGDFDTGSGHDFLDLSSIKGITDFDDLIDNHARDVAGDVVLSFGNGDRIVIESKAVGELRAEMFFL